MAYESEAERIARMANVAANGRAGTLGLIVFCLWAQLPLMALGFVALLFAAWFIEQCDQQVRRVLYWGWLAWFIFMAIVLLVLVIW